MNALNIGRVQIALHGVSAQIAQEAVTGLEGALRSRLGMLQVHGMAGVDMGELSLNPVHSTVVMDANALRALIAERLADAIQTRIAVADTGD